MGFECLFFGWGAGGLDCGMSLLDGVLSCRRGDGVDFWGQEGVLVEIEGGVVVGRDGSGTGSREGGFDVRWDLVREDGWV